MRICVPEVSAGQELVTFAIADCLGSRLIDARVLPVEARDAAVVSALSPVGDSFVILGYPSSEAEARSLDTFLASQAADIDVALWMSLAEGGDGQIHSTGEEAKQTLQHHYRGRVVEIRLPISAEEATDAVLSSLREAAIMRAGVFGY